MLSASTEGLPEHPWVRVRFLNSVLKSRLERILYLARRWSGAPVRILGSGPCNRCRPCRAVYQEPCAKPEKRIYPLEATGVDCAWAAEELFRQPLEWYSKDSRPKVTSVLGAVLASGQGMRSVRDCFESIIIPQVRK